MKYAEAIESAINNAALLEQQNGVWIPSYASEPVVASSIPVEGNHNYPITFPSRDEFTQPAHYVTADTADELRQVVLEYEKIANTSINPLVLDRELQHEQQHGEITRQLGGASLYAMKILENKEHGVSGWMLAHIAFDVTTTKIGAALLHAYPETPSNSDIAQINMLGYENLDEVSRIASEYGLPELLSLRSS